MRAPNLPARIHVRFSESVPDLLLDLLLRGLADCCGRLTAWPPRLWVDARAPILHSPGLQVWSGARRDDGTPWVDFDPQGDRDLTPSDLLVVTHAVTAPLVLPDLDCARAAVDAYDLPQHAFRDAARRAGWRVFARERPRADLGELPVDYCFNPLWAPAAVAPTTSRSVRLLLAGDFSVGRRDEWRAIVQSMAVPGAIIRQSAPLSEWYDLLGQTRACLCPHGAGEKTYRVWEAAAAGCALVVEKFSADNQPRGLRPQRDGVIAESLDGTENCLCFDPARGLNDANNVRAAIQTIAWNEGLAERFGAAAREEAWARHTPAAEAARFVEAATRCEAVPCSDRHGHPGMHGATSVGPTIRLEV